MRRPTTQPGPSGSTSPVIGAGVFFSALLLFLAELVVGKAALPRFGGTAAVWTTSLLFFQVVLLAGYAYAHLVSTRLSPRLQRGLHLVTVAAAVVTLIAQGLLWGRPLLAPAPGDAVHVAAVLGFLALSVGVPFFALSSTTTLLQAWVARAGGASPWRLYALSNAGSLLALVLYPLLLEPLSGLRAQALSWALGFGAWAVVLALAVARLGRTEEVAPPEAESRTEAPPSRGAHWRWLALSSLGTVFLATTTNVLCLEVAPTPVLWALPLALYLLSFIITFEGGGRLARPRLMVTLWALGLVGVLVNALMMPNISLLQAVVGFSLLQFSANVLCHGALYEARPAPRHLSSFYLWVSAGGALGTLAVAVLAPLAFDDYREFPLALLVMAGGVGWGLVRQAAPSARRGRLALAAAMAGLAVAAAGASSTVAPSQRRSLRNTFGVLRVEEENAPGDPFHAFVLRHGHVAHGAQLTAPDKQDLPTSYYTWNSGLGVGLRVLAERGALDVAVLGLGVGTITALLDSDDRVDFYDIDPNVVALAQGEGGFFHYLERAKPKVSVTLGDARHALQVELGQGPKTRDLLVVDVFSGDAVPAHLFTVEAMDLYWRHLRPDGLLALHVSNRHLELERVALGLARARGLHAVLINSAAKDLSADSTWVLVAKDSTLLDRLRPDASQVLVRSLPDEVVWTDDLNSLLPVIRLQ